MGLGKTGESIPHAKDITSLPRPGGQTLCYQVEQQILYTSFCDTI